MAEQVEVEMPSCYEYLVTFGVFSLPSAVTGLAQCFGGSLLYFGTVPNTSQFLSLLWHKGTTTVGSTGTV